VTAAEGVSQLAQLFDAIAIQVVASDASGRITYANPAWTVAASEAGATGACGPGDSVRGCLEVLVSDDAAREHASEGLARVLSGRSPRFELEVPRYVGDEMRWYLLVASALEGGGLVLAVVDVTSQCQAREIVVQAATHDRLTRLPNRVLLEDHLRHATARAARSSGLVAVLFCDLDDFKEDNDRYGHAVGDATLAAVGRRLSASLRQTDICGRWGGDEFVAVVEVDGPAGLEQVLERIHAVFANPVQVGDRIFDVRVSVGAVVVGPTSTPDGLVHQADAAMYRAKQAGERSVVVGPDTIDLTADVGWPSTA
jgi:diguanylate cyclase (GGDEF)-like protein